MALLRRSHRDGHQRHPIYATETAGLLVIAVILLVLIVVRYWHVMQWNWR